MKSNKGLATVIILGVLFVGCMAGGWVASKYLGPDNPIEEGLEDVAEDEVETITKAPKGSLKDEVDALFPHKKVDSK